MAGRAFGVTSPVSRSRCLYDEISEFISANIFIGQREVLCGRNGTSTAISSAISSARNLPGDPVKLIVPRIRYRSRCLLTALHQ